MLNWLKFTFGSYYSNKTSKEGANRSFWNVIFALFIMLVILTAFLSTGFNYSFATHYNNSLKYQEFLHNAFTIEDESKRINIQVLETPEGQVAKSIVAFYGNNSENEALINTFTNISDKETYSLNGYNLIVDTRPSKSTYFRFEIDVHRIDDVNQKIDFVKANRNDLYERLEYELSVVNKMGYTDYYLSIIKTRKNIPFMQKAKENQYFA